MSLKAELDADVDYRNRLEPAEILSSLQSLKEKRGAYHASTSR